MFREIVLHRERCGAKGTTDVVERAGAALTIIAAAAALIGFGSSILADDEGGGRKRRDHEVARKALLSGEIRPLEAVIAEARRTVPGEIVGVELENHHGRWTYKLKIITPAGTMQRVMIDARQTGDAVTGNGTAQSASPVEAPRPGVPKAP